ncbi:hypothetical protein vseg_008077 [Gypsophila vaccaria]
MAEVTKYQLISNNNNNNNNKNNNVVVSELKPYFCVFKLRKSSSFIYGIVLVFVLFSVFLAFFPASSSTWFVNIFTVNSTSSSSSPPEVESDRSHSYFLPNSSVQTNKTTFQNTFNNATLQPPVSGDSQNSSGARVFGGKVGEFEQNNSTMFPEIDQNPGTSAENNQSSQLYRDKVGNFEQNNSTMFPEIDQNPGISAGNNGSSQLSPDHHEKVGNFEQNNSTILAKIDQNPEISADNNQSPQLYRDKVGNIEQNNTTIIPKIDQNPEISANNTVIHNNQTSELPGNHSITPEISSNSTKKGANSSDLGALLSKNKGKIVANESNVAKREGNLVGNLVGCDLYDGNWVKDESYPLYKPGSCKLVDEQFNCFLNGRPDDDYQKLKWKPMGCSLPRLNGGHMLELLRGKRLVFVGDSLNRNMWESLVCILKNSVKDKKNVYEAFGRHHFRTEASYSFVFKDYNCTVEFFVSPFLVRQWEVKDKNGTTKETLRLDLMVSDADQYKNADYLVFNTGHWWTHDKTSKGEDYYQEGSHVYKQLDVTEAFRRAITTWGRWVDANINPQKTQVLFRGYSASHFSGGQWNSGGQCDSETEPITNETYLTPYPLKMTVFESVIKSMKTPVSYLNVTRLTDYRKDGHPSVYRKQHLSGDEKKSPLRYQDCSHWCLPGVPDSWNELLYAELLRKQFTDQQQTNKT